MDRKKIIILGIVLVVLLILGIGGVMVFKNNNNNIEPGEEIDDDEIIDINDSDKDLDFSFLKLENNKKNILYSPLSIKYALSMLSEGASGNTKVEIDNLLKDVNLTKYNNIEDTLSLANSIFIKDTFKSKVNAQFINDVKNKYNAEIKYDEFKNGNNVNKWIEEKTLGLIKKAISDEIDPLTRMMLINALAIDMEWESSFDTNSTYGKQFNTINNEEYIATTMSNTFNDNASYYIDNDVTVLSMDLKKYEDTQLEYITIMPNNLDEYIKGVNVDKINNLTNKLINASDTEAGIDVTIPKYKFDYNLQLKKDLNTLGIKDAFNSSKADFSNISAESLYVSDAIHKANVEFSEDGIKAAAVTIFTVFENALPGEQPKPIKVTIDKPFMFIIRDKQTKELWFVGTVYEPNLWEDDKEEYEKAREW